MEILNNSNFTVKFFFSPEYLDVLGKLSSKSGLRSKVSIPLTLNSFLY